MVFIIGRELSVEITSKGLQICISFERQSTLSSGHRILYELSEFIYSFKSGSSNHMH